MAGLLSDERRFVDAQTRVDRAKSYADNCINKITRRLLACLRVPPRTSEAPCQKPRVPPPTAAHNGDIGFWTKVPKVVGCQPAILLMRYNTTALKVSIALFAVCPCCSQTRSRYDPLSPTELLYQWATLTKGSYAGREKGAKSNLTK